MNEELIDTIKQIKKDILAMQNELEDKKTDKNQMFGLLFATVVDTVDPLKRGRVRFYTPYLADPGSPLEGLHWASPISSFGGFDDSGMIAIPPAGSKIAVLFENGNVDSAFYIGTIWASHKGPDGQQINVTGYPNKEYDCLYSGKRNGYNFGDNTGDQSFFPWNTESYNGYDNDSIIDFYTDDNQYRSITYPNISGFKTVGKHGKKWVDGDYKCNMRSSRVEDFSARGNVIIFKDDHLHPAGQYAFGKSDNKKIAFCHNKFDAPEENPCCEDDSVATKACLPKRCFSKKCTEQTSTSNSTIDRTTKFANPFYKRKEEMRFYVGAPTPQNNKCDLEQSGIHIQSLSGNKISFDDSVNQPTGVPNWNLDFNFGCDDTYRGKMDIVEATGHRITLNGQEDIGHSKIRGENNGISARTACGNFFDLNDHTLSNGPCTPEKAGKNSGVTLSTRSSHLLRMSDKGIKQTSEVRKDGGEPTLAGEGYEGYVMLKSGYGLELLMKDQGRQDQTDNQFIQLTAPQKNNPCGPHMLVMQESSGTDGDGTPGLVMLRAGGVYYQSSCNTSVEVVGNDDTPSSKFTVVTDSYLIETKDYYFNHNRLGIHYSDDYLFLLAGAGCPKPDDPDNTVTQAKKAIDGSIVQANQNPGTSAGQSQSGDPCIHHAITDKDAWVCPHTNYTHFGYIRIDENTVLDSRSKTVFIATGRGD